ncbi:MAG: Trm112 family protein [Terracidiphilus sp.]
MAAMRVPQLKFDASVLGQLACPVCLGDLRLDGERIVCVQCGRAYPLVDGIPVLIGERAEAARGEDGLK